MKAKEKAIRQKFNHSLLKVNQPSNIDNNEIDIINAINNANKSTKRILQYP